MDILKVEKCILAKIKPPLEEEKRMQMIANEVMSVLQKQFDKNVELFAGGSFGKGTWIKGNHDIDIYVMFDKKQFSKKDISHMLEEKLKKVFPDYEKIHGSRDYFHLEFGKVTVELIPILKIKDPSEAENITDVSPFHVLWVKKNGGKLFDHIRLAKKFCKANHLYGAESFIRGFSGYCLEILTIYYGSFFNFLKAASFWKDIEIIDPAKLLQDPLKELNEAKIISPLILVDPVQKERNAATSLGIEKYEKFKKLCKKFLEGPSVSFFKHKKFDLASLKRKASHNKLIIITAEPLQGKLDVVGTKILKAYSFIKEKIKNHDFCIIDSDWYWDKKGKAKFWYITHKVTLPEKRLHWGPPAHVPHEQKKFKEKHGEVFEHEGRLYTFKKREHVRVSDFIKKLAKESEYIQQQVASIKVDIYYPEH